MVCSHPTGWKVCPRIELPTVCELPERVTSERSEEPYGSLMSSSDAGEGGTTVGESTRQSDLLLDLGCDSRESSEGDAMNHPRSSTRALVRLGGM